MGLFFGWKNQKKVGEILPTSLFWICTPKNIVFSTCWKKRTDTNFFDSVTPHVPNKPVHTDTFQGLSRGLRTFKVNFLSFAFNILVWKGSEGWWQVNSIPQRDFNAWIAQVNWRLWGNHIASSYFWNQTLFSALKKDEPVWRGLVCGSKHF